MKGEESETLKLMNIYQAHGLDIFLPGESMRMEVIVQSLVMSVIYTTNLTSVSAISRTYIQIEASQVVAIVQT